MMPQAPNHVPHIQPGAITGMTGLADRPVFFVHLNGSTVPNVVVKGDNPREGQDREPDMDAEISIQWGSKLMKNVQNSMVNTKIMTDLEIQTFKYAALATFPRGSKQFNNVSGVDPTTGQYISYTWVKMPYVAGLTTTDFVDKESKEAIPKSIYRNIHQFAQEAVWTDLGKVVAVDIFNGNNDRFTLDGGMWMNYSNIMFVNAGPTKVIGLDMYDPNGSKGTETFSNLNTGGGFEALKILIDPAKRDQFATQCVKSVGTVLKRELGGGSGKNGGSMYIDVTLVGGTGGPQRATIAIAKLDEFFLDFKDNFKQGIENGANELKMYLQRKAQEYGSQRRAFPQGIMARMAYLNWAPNRPLAQAPPLPQQGAPVQQPQFQRGAVPRGGGNRGGGNQGFLR